MRKYFLFVFFFTLCWCAANKAEAQVVLLPQNTTINGSLSPAGKVDTFKVITTADGQLNFDLASTNGINVTIVLYDKDTATQLGNTTTAGNASLSVNGLAAGTYFVRTYSYYSNQEPTYTLKYNLTLTPVANDNEPNNSKDQALTLAQNSTVTGHVGYYNNKQRDVADWYKLTTNSDGQLTLKLTSHNALNASVYLYDNDGVTQLNTITTAATGVVKTDGLAAGTYYVKINSYYGEQFEPYTLTDSLFAPVVANDAEPNGSKEQALRLAQNSSVTGHVGYYYNKQRDVADWYKVTANSDGLLQLKLTSHNGLNVSVYLFDNDGTTQLNTLTTTATAYVNTDGLAAGTYYLKINSYYDEQFEPYTLADSLFVPAVANDAEPNDSKEQAQNLSINSSITGHVGYYYNTQRDIADWYKVVANKDGMLQLKLTSHNGSNVSVYLFDADGTTQLNTLTTTATGYINTDGLGAGTYYLKINSYYGTQFEPYSLTDSLFAYNANDPEPNNNSHQANVIPANSTANGHINFYYNNTRDAVDWWKIVYNDLSGNLKLSVNLLPNLSDNTSKNIIFQLYKDTLGAPVYSNVFASSKEINLSALSQGEYYIKVIMYYGNQFQAYSITPTFKQAVSIANIVLFYSSAPDSCSRNSLTYKLSGSYSPLTPFTVVLFRNNIAYDSMVVNNDVALFSLLPEGSYYASVHGFGAEPADYRLSTIKVFSPVVPTPVPTGTPVVTKTGRLLHATPQGELETLQWYRNGTLIPGATDSTFLATDAGTYTARFANACGSGQVSNSIFFSKPYQNQTITFAPLTNMVYAPNVFIVLHATATSALPVKYRIISGPATVINDTVYISGAGIITIEATQQGDDNYGIAPPVQRSFNVTKANQAISFTPVPSKIFGDVPFVLSAASTSGLPVNFSIASGLAILNGAEVTITGVGSVSIKASQAGNTNYSAAPDSIITFCTGVRHLSPVTGDTLVCPATFKYGVVKVPGALYEWGVTGGGTMAAVNDTATVQWQTPGTYIVYAKGYSSCDAVRSEPSSLAVRVTPIIAPDKVTNMVPANGAANMQLPITFSWVPGLNTSSFDFYLWDADSAQTAVPYAANLTAVNYILSNTTLKYNHAYKWMVVSKNACSQSSGPVQTFSMVPLPDLVASDVQVPATAFSGQTISISWKIANIGPGRTTLNQRWTDAVFMSFDTLPNFNIPPNTNPGAWALLELPVRPLLVATAANVSALDSGQSYTNSASFKLPVNYGWPLHVYVITNYAPGATAPLETSLLNDTAHAPGPIVVTTSPTPDLRVESVITSNSTFSGSAINVAYSVKNYGVTTPSGDNWMDKVYISKDPLFDVDNALLLHQPKANGTYYFDASEAAFFGGGQLQKDSFYNRSVEVVVPNFIYGSYFIYVVTDANSSVYEGTTENNNTNRSQVQVFLTPTPQLTVSSITLPVSKVSTSQVIGVNWEIKNLGYNDNIEKNKGHYLARVNYCATCYTPVCNPPPVNCTKCAVVCPPSQPGYTVKDSVGFGSSRWVDKVYLSSDSTHLDVNNAVLLGSYNHTQGFLLADDNVRAHVPVGSQGIPEALDPHTYDINTLTAINAGSVFKSNLNFQVPGNIAPGNYYVYVYANADQSVFEFPVQKQVRRSTLPIEVLKPDLSVSDLTVPATGIAGQNVAISYTILNTGPGSVFNSQRKDLVYMSTSPVFDANAKLVASPSYTEDIPINVAVKHQANFVLPVNISGTYFFFVYTNGDSLIRESNQYNNFNSNLASISIAAAQAPNLLVSDIAVAPIVSSVSGFPFKYTVPNQGVGPTYGSWTDSIFISCSPVYNPSTAYGIAARVHNEVVPAGSGYTDEFILSIPFTFEINNCFGQATSPAYFFVKTNAGNDLFEGNNAGNNVLGTGVKTIVNPLVDHIITTATVTGNVTAGRNFIVSWTVKNIGANPGTKYYNSWSDAVYFSKDSVFSSAAVFAGNVYQNNPLNPNQSYTTTSGTFVTPNLAEGNYYIFVKTNYSNSIFAERQLNNNTYLIRSAPDVPALLVHVVAPILPDLTDTIIGLPSSVAIGQPLKIIYNVLNKGAGVTYPSSWSDNFWLSGDYIPGNAGDINLGSINHSGALQAGDQYVDSLIANIAMNIAPGNYILIAKTNAGGNVFETNAGNNLAFKFINVYIPAPADLMVTDVAHPDTVLLGVVEKVTWNILNNSANSAEGIETDGVYLSKTALPDSTAVLLGTKTNTLRMLPLSVQPVELSPVFQDVAEGNYYVVVVADLLNNIVENYKDNNSGARAKPVYVKVKELPLEVLASGDLNNLNAYYKLVIPAPLNGATILLTLKTGDSLKVTNQLFVGLGYIPSAAHFDYAYDAPNAGNQQILIPSVTVGTYYITIKCVTPNPPLQHITLLAQNLPFAIVNVSAKEGGNSGQVTVKLTGSLFSNNMQAILSKGAASITSSAVYFINSTTVYATFNLLGVQLGVYDVTLKKADNTTTKLVGGFTVVAPNNGGLITGSGVNTGQVGSGDMAGCDPGAASGLNAQLQTEIIIPPKVFAGWPFTIQINYSNPTNVDIPAQVRILYSIDGLPVSLTKEGLADGNSSLYLEFAEQNGLPNIIRAGGSGTIKVYSKAPTNYPGHKLANYELK